MKLIGTLLTYMTFYITSLKYLQIKMYHILVVFCWINLLNNIIK